MKQSKIAIFLLVIFILSGGVYFFKSCQKPAESSEETQAIPLNPAPSINPDTAYSYVAKQVAFGPRVPNSESAKKAGIWIINTLKSFGVEVIEQDFVGTTYDKKTIYGKNIIGVINPSAPKRILLAAHWDSRSIADKDKVSPNTPIDGANDGASSTGLILEIARTIQLAKSKPNVGVDLIFFDAEDTGEPENYKGKRK